MTKRDDEIKAAEIAGAVRVLREYAHSLDELERNVIASGQPGPVVVQLSSVIAGLYGSARNLERAQLGLRQDLPRLKTHDDEERTNYLDDHLDT